MRHAAKTERLSSLALALVAAANLLFVLSFFVVLLLAAAPARAEQAPACGGDNLLDEIRISDPAAFAEIEAKAAAVPNGSGLLWKVEKPGVAPSFLYGTMHLTDPRVIDLGREARAAFDAAGTVVIETTEVLDPSAMVAVMTSRPDLIVYGDGQTIFSALEPGDGEAVKAALAERGIPAAGIERLKPWMLAAVLSLPACEMARKASGLPFLDIKLARDAEAAGKRIAGLETLADQLSAMASLPEAFHLEGLVATLKLGDGIDDVFETMVSLYVSGEVGTLWPLIHSAVPMGEDAAAGYAAFEETMITVRNRTMAANAAPFLDAGAAFVAVGALHLPGENGLVELLRAAGYAVTRAG